MQAPSTERGTGPVTGYVAKQSVTATKTDTPVLETPQSISIVPKDQIEAQQAQSLVEALRYTPGLTMDLYGANSAFDAIYVRGFQARQFLDGLRVPFDPGSTFSTPRIEPYGLERIEVLKGPSSGLYGQTDPGGFINMISKRPTATPFYEVEGQVGSFDRYQGAFDVGGPVTKDGDFLYRFTGLVRDSNTQIDFVQDNKIFLAPSFTWRPTADTSFTMLSGYQLIDNKGYQQYVPAQGSLWSNPNGRIPYSRYLGEPSVDGYKHEQWWIGYAFEHRFNDVFQFRQNARYFYTHNDLTGVRSEGLAPDMRTLNRSVNYVDADSHNIAVDTHVQVNLQSGPFAHKFLVGVDYFDVKSKTDYRFAFINPIDVFNPVYGLGGVPPASTLAPFFLYDDTQRQAGIYVQDEIRFDRFILTLTQRADWVENETISTGLFGPGVFSRSDSATTGRAGLTYLFDFGLAPYANYATSFIPIRGVDGVTLQPYRPSTGQGYELGVKYQPTGMNLLFTAAFFDITQRDVVAPVNALISTQVGEARVRGFELEARGNVTRELEIIAGYSKLDPRITDHAQNAIVGNYMVNTAIETASLWAMYTWRNGPLAGFGIGAGVRHTGESYGDEANTIRITPYTLYDAVLAYDFSHRVPELKGWKAQLNATNLADEYYVASCLTGPAFCGLGAGRTILFTLKYASNSK